MLLQIIAESSVGPLAGTAGVTMLLSIALTYFFHGKVIAASVQKKHDEAIKAAVEEERKEHVERAKEARDNHEKYCREMRVDCDGRLTEQRERNRDLESRLRLTEADVDKWKAATFDAANCVKQLTDEVKGVMEDFRELATLSIRKAR